MLRLFVIFFQPIIWLVCRVLFRIELNGVENVPARGPVLVTPNHSTYLDPVWITIPINRQVHYMAWDEMFNIPMLGFVMRIFGAFPVKLEGADASAQKEAIQLLRNGELLVIFPEGGRTRTGRVMPFKMGAFRLALTQGVTVVPCVVAGGNKVWPKQWLLPRPGKISITFLPAIEVEALPEDTSRIELKRHARVLADKTRQVVMKALGEEPVAEDEADAEEPLKTEAAS